jgi:nucleotide-binding universal stress UspA family protein
MTLKDLLVYVDAGAATMARIDLAVALARRHQAHLTMLHVLTWPAIPPYVAAQIPASVLESQRDALRADAKRLERSLRDRAEAADIRVEWRSVEGDVLEVATVHGRYCDLAIIGQAAEDDPGASGAIELPERLALEIGRPVLIVPRYGAFAGVGERVLVAWNGSREGTRAINDALPILAGAKAVTVLSINPPSGMASRVPGADIALHLARHGVKSEAATAMAEDIAVGDILLSRASDLGADLIVMGAYGHSRVRELVLGGATRHILQHMTVPILMAH